MNGTSFIKEIGRSYIVSSFIPAALFMSLGVIIFHGFVPEFFLSGIEKTNMLLGINENSSLAIGSLFILFITTTWVAFGLYSSTNWTIQLYEGYKFPGFLSEIMTFRLRQRWHRKKVDIYEARRADFENPESAKIDDMEIVREIAFDQIQNLEGYAPIDADNLLPTRLGNVLRASEYYADERYKLNSLIMFPKLLHVFPVHFVNELEDKNNRFVFLLHSSLMAYIIGVVALFVGILNKIFVPLCGHPSKWIGNPLCEDGFIARGFSVLSASEYVILGLIFLTVGYVLYRVSVAAAREFALHIRAGFDLYRFDLLRQLNHRLPTTLNDEKRIWEKLSEYFVAANRLQFAEITLSYQYYEKPDKNKE